MATISLSLSAKADKTTGKSEILIRFVVGSRINQRGKSNIFIEASHWNAKDGRIVIPKFRLMNETQKQLVSELQAADTQLANLTQYIMQAFQAAGSGKVGLAKDWLRSTINEFNNFTAATEETKNQPTFFDQFNKYLADKKFAAHRETEYRVLERILKRYELYSGQELTFDNVTGDTLRDFEKYLYSEHELYKQGKLEKVLEQVNESRKPQPRGENAVCDLMKKFRAFYRWANGLSKSERLTDNNPFDNYTMPQEKYGTPYYITIDERKQLYNAPLRKPYATQRDIFVFQCLIGCRVSDLWSMTKDNIINGKVQYIPSKTKDEKPETVTVPLTATAKEILDRYKDWGGKSLFPFTSQQHYNLAIKEMFKMAGLDRVVTVLNPTTREEEKRPLYEVASSHMARRTFVGNLYKQVKDPNLICPMSGHKVGSKAFARYRAIDEDLMKETVNLLD